MYNLQMYKNKENIVNMFISENMVKNHDYTASLCHKIVPWQNKYSCIFILHKNQILETILYLTGYPHRSLQSMSSKHSIQMLPLW